MSIERTNNWWRSLTLEEKEKHSLKCTPKRINRQVFSDALKLHLSESLAVYWSKISSKEYETHKLKCVPLHNAQVGKTHSNPIAISIGVKQWWDDYGRENWRGEQNPNWHGGNVTNFYVSAEWYRLRQIVLIRDDYTCQLCGKRSIKGMHVHHSDGDITNNDLSNLITRCFDCHIYKRLVKEYARNE